MTVLIHNYLYCFLNFCNLIVTFCWPHSFFCRKLLFNDQKMTLIRRRVNTTKEKYAEFCFKMLDMVMKSRMVCAGRTRIPTPSECNTAKRDLEHMTKTKLLVDHVNENDFDYTVEIACSVGVVQIHFKW